LSKTIGVETSDYSKMRIASLAWIEVEIEVGMGHWGTVYAVISIAIALVSGFGEKSTGPLEVDVSEQLGWYGARPALGLLGV
jgi:hypothetical protein